MRVAHCVQDGKSCAHESTIKPQKAHDVVFCRLCGFLPSLWFFAVFVVFWRALWFLGELVVFAVFVVFVGFVVFCRLCGFLPSLWFFGELVDLRSTVVINGKPQRDLTTESRLC